MRWIMKGVLRIFVVSITSKRIKVEFPYNQIKKCVILG